MPDTHFEHPRLASIYDALDGDRSDLQIYLETAAAVEARRVLDVGCGTGTFALMLADRGLEVTAVDPAAGSLAVARQKPGAGRVQWVHGDATSLPPLLVDLATMTANVAQAIVDPDDWLGTLTGIRAALRPDGHLTFETRDPQLRAWEAWTAQTTRRTTAIDGVGEVETWVELTSVDLPLVTFRSYFGFAADGAVLTSDSTLRFRESDEIVSQLESSAYAVVGIRQLEGELVFSARRRG